MSFPTQISMFVKHARVEGPGAYQVSSLLLSIVHDYVVVRALNCITVRSPRVLHINIQQTMTARLLPVASMVEFTAWYSPTLARLIQMLYILCTKR